MENKITLKEYLGNFKVKEIIYAIGAIHKGRQVFTLCRGIFACTDKKHKSVTYGKLVVNYEVEVTRMGNDHAVFDFGDKAWLTIWPVKKAIGHAKE